MKTFKDLSKGLQKRVKAHKAEYANHTDLLTTVRNLDEDIESRKAKKLDVTDVKKLRDDVDKAIDE